MPPIIPFLPAIISGASGIVGSLIQNKKSNRTSEQHSSFDNTTSPVFSGGQLKTQDLIGETLRKILSQGEAVPQWARNQGRTEINNTFDAMRPRLEAALTARGFGQSGKLGAGFKDLEIQRGNAFQNLEGDLRQQQLQRLMQALGLGESFAFAAPGQHATGSSTGTATGPSQFGNTIGQAGGDIGSLLLLQKLLGSGGSPSSLPSFGGTGSDSFFNIINSVPYPHP